MEPPDTIAEDGESSPDSITVLGDSRVELSRDTLASLPSEERAVTIACASGERHTARWRGVPVMELLSAADVPDETTHLLVESGDGYRMCVDIYAALDGMLALFRDGEPIAAQNPYATRFIAPDIDGARTVKGVATLEARHLAAGTDPEALEVLSETEEYAP